MQSPPQNPAQVLLWLIGIPGGLALVTLLVKGIWFVAKASTQLEVVNELVKEFREYRRDSRDLAQGYDLSLTIIESDLNAVQAKVGLPVRPFPDRRTGPADRRAS